MRLAILLSLAFITTLRADDLAARLKELADKPILPKDFDAPNMLSRDVRARLKEANLRDYEAWQKVQTKEDWEKFRDQRIAALKKSLGEWPEPPKDMKVRVTKTIEGDGYKIENTLFESRPGLWVTANVYQPAKPLEKMPGILIVHSHHNPKHEGELQDMGVTWAKAGCYVLVMDQLGHGERRIHPFTDAKSYPEPFRVGRQDYYFRYNLGIQLSLIGESLIGWMAWDLMRGVDVLLKKPGIDPEKIILLGAVAGGGDPAAVTAALDSRIKCVVPFNFGGPQPETKPLGENAEKEFNYAGGGSWESTRNLRNSAKDGFLPWVICASVAPRHLIHAHEFAWDKDHDPVWKRYQKIWGFYGADDKLSYTHGKGQLSGRPPEASHCNNIGPLHRESIHKAFEKWFGIKAVETKDRHMAEELACWTEELRQELKPDVVGAIARFAKPLTDAANERLGSSVDASYAQRVRKDWDRVLASAGDASFESVRGGGSQEVDGVKVHSVIVNTYRDVQVPAMLLTPRGQGPFPCVLAISHDGRAGFLKERSEAIAKLLANGCAICLIDVRGTGETKAGNSRERGSSATSVSSSEQMLGGSLFEGQLRDLLAVHKYITSDARIDKARLAIWGESFAKPNGSRQDVATPYDAEKFPSLGEPGAAGVAMCVPLYCKGIKAILCRGGLLINGIVPLSGCRLLVPHDSLLPAVGTTYDWMGLMYLPTSPALRVERPILPSNQAAEENGTDLYKGFQLLRDRQNLPPLEIDTRYSTDADIAAWFKKALKD